MAHRMKKETHDIPEWAIYWLAYGECDGSLCKFITVKRRKFTYFI